MKLEGKPDGDMFLHPEKYIGPGVEEYILVVQQNALIMRWLGHPRIEDIHSANEEQDGFFALLYELGEIEHNEQFAEALGRWDAYKFTYKEKVVVLIDDGEGARTVFFLGPKMEVGNDDRDTVA
jgi:hypothetical protein